MLSYICIKLIDQLLRNCNMINTNFCFRQANLQSTYCAEKSDLVVKFK